MSEHEMRALYQQLVARRSDASRAGCPAPEQIMTLAEGSLAEAERLRLLHHVSACSFCQRDLAAARTVARTRERPAARLTSWIGLAAAAAAIVAAVLVVRPGSDTGAPDVMRSGQTAVTLVRPTGTVSAGDTMFVWRSIPRATRYHMEVLDPAGAVVHAAQTADTTLGVPRRLLPPNEYFWRVTASLDDGSTRASGARRFEVR